MGIRVALSPYPLSSTERRRLEDALGEPLEYRSVTELRRLPLTRMVRSLRPADAVGCLLVLTDPSAAPLLPMLHAIAAAAGYRRVAAVRPDDRPQPLPAWRMPQSLAALVGASASNARAIQVARRELTALLGRERLELQLGAGQRVLYLSANLWFGVTAGGSVGHIAGVANGLAAAGYEVEIAAMSIPPLLVSGVRPMALRPPVALGVPFEANGYRFTRDIVRQLRPTLSTHRATFLYERLAASSYAGVMLSRTTATPLVLEYNGSEAWVARHWGRALRYHDLAVAAEDVCLRHAHLVVTVSEVLRDELLERGVPDERVVAYPNCIDPAIFDPGRFDAADRGRLRRSLGIPAEATVVTFVGTFGKWHGVDVLARAIASLVAADESWLERNAVRFLLVGDGLKSAEVSAILSADERCGRFVVKAGLVPQPDAPAYLSTSDIVVSPHVRNPDGSRFFGSPTKLFEYMAMAKPIVASDLDQIGDVLRPGLRVEALPAYGPGPNSGELAVLAPPGEVEALARAIRFLVERPEWRAVLGANARARALQRYTWRDHVAAILERLHEVLAPTRLRETAEV